MGLEQALPGPLFWGRATERPPVGPAPQPNATRRSTKPGLPLGSAFAVTVSQDQFPAEISSAEPAAPIQLAGVLPTPRVRP